MDVDPTLIVGKEKSVVVVVVPKVCVGWVMVVVPKVWVGWVSVVVLNVGWVTVFVVENELFPKLVVTPPTLVEVLVPKLLIGAELFWTFGWVCPWNY